MPPPAHRRAGGRAPDPLMPGPAAEWRPGGRGRGLRPRTTARRWLRRAPDAPTPWPADWRPGWCGRRLRPEATAWRRLKLSPDAPTPGPADWRPGGRGRGLRP